MSSPTSSRFQRVWEKIKYAFQLNPSQPLSEEEEDLLRRIAVKIYERKMTAPAILALHSMKPMNFIGSQALVGLQPFLELLVSRQEYELFVSIIERRDGFERLIELIEGQESGESHEQ